jgi:carbon monoxide dehydrogenase subunit G
MKLENEFTVPASVEAAWDVLLDVERVAPCLPGATLEGEQDGEYAGTMKIKIGPITTSYKGTVKIEEADESARRAVMRAQARDSRGQGTAAATITSTMEEVEGGTRVHVETDMRVTGPAAQFGRGVMQDVSAKLMGRFADCLAEEIAGAGATAATSAPAETAPAAETPSAPAPDDARVVGPLNPAANPPPGPAGESAEAAARPAAAAAAKPAAAPRRSEEVLDLGEASREAVIKRVAPVAAVLLGLIVILGLRRRGR